MSEERKKRWVIHAFTLVFLGLALAFLLDLWGPVPSLPAPAPTDPVFTKPASPRVTTTELHETGGDLSMLRCYACHDKETPVEPLVNEKGNIVLSEDHRDLIVWRLNCTSCHTSEQGYELEFDEDFEVILPEGHLEVDMRHGREFRNNNCFNCHARENLERLYTRDGRELEFTESNLLCASCHGPSYRDWELGIHGRTSGYWDRRLGEATRLDCTACHDPHAPAFPAFIPGPGPQAPLPLTRQRGADQHKSLR